MKIATVVGSSALGLLLIAGSLVPQLASAKSTDELVNALCSKVVVCGQSNPKLRKQIGTKQNACSDQLGNASTASLWGNFGLSSSADNRYKAQDIEGMLSNGEILLSRSDLSQCVQEINDLDCSAVSNNAMPTITNVGFAVSDKGACPKIYKTVVAPTTTAGQLIDSVCTAYSNCQKGDFSNQKLAKQTCVAQLNGPAGRTMWDSFGLKRAKDQYTASELEQQISSHYVNVDVKALNECKQQKIPSISCEDFGKNVTANNWDNINKVLGHKGGCKDTLSASRK